MGCPNKKTNEVFICNTLFKYDLVEECNGIYELVAIPCNLPTAVYDIAKISTKTNACMGLDFYQAFINTDPVEIIQDCSLEHIIERAIYIYFENAPSIDCNSCSSTCKCNKTFGFF